jgi:hypothetical protein
VTVGGLGTGLYYTTTRRFPPPWRAEKMPGGYVVRHADA